MRRSFIVAAGLLALAVSGSASPALAKWGCGARASDGFLLDNYGFDTEAEARADALKCGHPGCRIISCSSSIDTTEQALAKWPIKTISCGGHTGKDCPK